MKRHFRMTRGGMKRSAGNGTFGSETAGYASSAMSRLDWWNACLLMARALLTGRTASYIRGVSATLVLLLATSNAFAQGASIYGQAVGSTGKPVAFGSVRVCAYTGGGLPCSPLSSL